MISQNKYIKYAAIVAVVTGLTSLYLIWIIRHEKPLVFKVFKLSSGYASLLVTSSPGKKANIFNQPPRTSILIGAGENFDVVRKVGEVLPPSYNQIDYLILPSRSEDNSGALDVIKRFKVNTIIMLPIADSYVETSSSTVAVVTNKVLQTEVYQLARQNKIPILFVRREFELNTDHQIVKVIPLYSNVRNQIAAASYIAISLDVNSPRIEKGIEKQKIILLGKSTKSMSRDLLGSLNQDEGLSKISKTIVTYQTFSENNIYTKLIRDIHPKTLVVSSLLRPSKKSSKASSKTNTNIERILTEEGTKIWSLVGKDFYLDF